MTPVSDADHDLTVNVCGCSHGNQAAGPGNSWHQEAGARRAFWAFGEQNKELRGLVGGAGRVNPRL